MMILKYSNNQKLIDRLPRKAVAGSILQIETILLSYINPKMSSIDGEWHYIESEYNSAANKLRSILGAMISNHQNPEEYICNSKKIFGKKQSLSVLKDFEEIYRKFELAYIEKIIQLQEKVRDINIKLLLNNKKYEYELSNRSKAVNKTKTENYMMRCRIFFWGGSRWYA